MNVANQSVIRRLTARFLKAGGTRNIIAVIAIALTAVMFTSVFTLGGNLLAVIQDQTMRQVGTSAHGGLKYLSVEQYEHFARSPLIKDISYNRLLALAENEALKKLQCEIRYSEDKMAEWGFAFPSTGKMPQHDNEIACDTIVLDALGVPREIGAPVPLAFTVGGRPYSQTFTLSGFWEGDPAMPARQVWLSKAYVDAVLAENVIEDKFAGKIFADVWFNNSFDIEGKMLNLINGMNDVDYGVNWAYAASDIDIDPALMAVCILVLALILFSGYLIIYSIFVISVNTDIHFYGLLKTIGTTGKQIRKIIRTQALVLSAFGIPAGLLLGYIFGVYLSPFILNMLSDVRDVRTSANPLIFIFAAAFSMLTVFIGCRKPGQIAARVSPVEAVKYSGVTSKTRAKKTRKVTMLSMAWANVTREKRKLCMIVMSLSLALILLNSAFSATQSFDMDEYLSSSIISDFAVADYSIFHTGGYKNTNGVSAGFLREAQARGAEEIANIYYHNHISKENSVMGPQVYGVGKKEVERFSGVDYEKLRAGHYVIVSEYVITYGDDGITIPQIGDTLTLTNDSGDTRDFEVIGLMGSYPTVISARFRFTNSLDVVMADEVFLDFYGAAQPMQTNINVSAEELDAFEAWLNQYITNQNPDLSFISRNTLKAEFDGLRTTYVTVGGAMSLILALIGVMNFINAVVASVIARRRELAMLQSVGMTGRQIRSSLFFEGVCYTALTAFFTLTAGLGLSWLIVKVMAGQIWFFTQNLTVMPSVLSLAPLLVICAAVPPVCHAKLNRDSLVDRLRVE